VKVVAILVSNSCTGLIIRNTTERTILTSKKRHDSSSAQNILTGTLRLLLILLLINMSASPEAIGKLLFIYLLLTAVGLTPGGSSTVHIYTQTVHGIRVQGTEHT
jgi:hypothetical protein